MMSTARKELIVGVVFFGILVMIGAFTIVLRGGVEQIIRPPQDLIVHFPDGIGGLREGNVVRISGLEVGQVQSLRLMPIGVLAHLTVRNEVHLHPGYQVKVRAFSLLGGYVVEIDRGYQHLEPLHLQLTSRDYGRMVAEGSEVRSRIADRSIEHHLDGPAEGRPLKGDVEADVLALVADMADEIKPDIEAAVRNIREVTDKINETQGTLGKLVGDPQLYDSLTSSAMNIDVATEYLVRILHNAAEGEGTVGRLLTDERLYESTTEAMTRIESITRRIDEGQGPIGRLVTSEQMAANLERSVDSLERILAAAASEEEPGTIAKLLHDPALYDELTATAAELRHVAEQVAQARGPLGVLIHDERAADSLRNTLANIETATDAIAQGRGTVGRLIMDDRLIMEAERVMVEFRESVEDLREQAPINAFVQAVFTAF